MEKTLYFLVAFLESVLGVFGIRAPLEQSSYTVARELRGGIEIRDYAPRVAIETATRGPGDGDAFRRLFNTISGGNRRGERIAMTAPVEASGERVAMTVPVEQDAARMRFFLPETVAADPPAPNDPAVHVVRVPGERLAVLRFTGRASEHAKAQQTAELLGALDDAGVKTQGAPFFMGYDPPFTIPFLRRNEMAVRLRAD